jgi:excisionase family DNA binding protein
MQKLLSFEEMAQLSGIKVPTWRAWAARRMFPIVRLGRRVKVRESDFERFIAERVVPAAPERSGL